MTPTPLPDGTMPAAPHWAMERAAALAAAGYPHPNPRVGAVIIGLDGTTLAEAAHQGPGTPHAEAAALAGAGIPVRGATVYVTLEPCSHHGNTPPCVEQLIAADVAAVVIGARDPDHRVDGRGITALRDAGIRVSLVGGTIMEAVDPGYFHHRRTGRPRVTLKAAATIDGQVAAADGTSQWITSEPARVDGHRLRAAADAVLIGAGTLRSDDPRLTVRLTDTAQRQPRPVVVAGMAPLPQDRRVYGRDPIVYVPAGHDQPPATATVAAGTQPTKVDLDVVLEDLGARGIIDLLIEGGPTVAASFFELGLIDHLVVYLGARVAGGVGKPIFNGTFPTLRSAVDASIASISRVGPDLRLDISLSAKEAGHEAG